MYKIDCEEKDINIRMRLSKVIDHFLEVAVESGGGQRLLAARYSEHNNVQLFSGGLQNLMIMVALNFIYNDLGAADGNFVLRNLMNALGFMNFIVGVSCVIGGPKSSFSPDGLIWVALAGWCVFSTISLQDLYDQKGDSARKRHTAVVLGDPECRVMIITGILLGSTLITSYLEIIFQAMVLGQVFLTLLIATKALFNRTIPADKGTFKLWSLWLLMLYLLPTFVSPHFSLGQL